MSLPIRIGIDLGGTKIAIKALNITDREVLSRRIATPRHDYAATLSAIRGLIEQAEAELNGPGPATIGIAMPGSISPATGLVQNANSTWLNGRAFDKDLQAHLGRPVRLANDANCFALSEALDGAGKNARSVFGVILGTGCGGGLVYDGRLINGPRGIGGEWGHNPLPWPKSDELPGPSCWCGLNGCMESWVSGPGLHQDYLSTTGDAQSAATAVDVITRVDEGDIHARAALDRYTSRLARGFAMVVNIFDPEIIVLGGGLSQISALYETLPGLMEKFIFADTRNVTICPPVHSDTSGARGAARLWDMPK